jgi:hypothetical protein
MVVYTIVDMDVRRRRAALRCSQGGYHIATIAGPQPGVGTRFAGARPRSGYAVLQEASTRRTVHALFQSTYFTQEETLSQLHPCWRAGLLPARPWKRYRC